MRIQPEELSAIVSTVSRFDRESEIFLFGSRLDDEQKGGDIDILVKSDRITKKMLAEIEDNLFHLIDEQKIDFVLTRKDQLSTFARMVLAARSVKIW